MNKLALSVLILVCLPAPPAAAQGRKFGNIRLLEGYQYRQGPGVDALIGLIAKEGGLTIQFESGPQQGYWADPKEKRKYIWYREQTVNGHRVMLALTEPGVGTVWRPEKPRSPKKGKVLMITFPGTFGPDDATNFWAEVVDEREVADMILMVLTFDPSKS